MTYGYIRVSTDMQTVENQRFEITRFLDGQNPPMKVDGWIEETISGAKDYNKRELGHLLKDVKKGDLIVCAEISRLGRSLFMVMEILSICMNKGCMVWTIKDNYRLGDDLQSKVLAFAFSLAAEIERNMISQRTKVALDKLKSEGKVLGRPKGRKSSKTKLTGHEDEVRERLAKRESETSIAADLGVDRATLCKFIADHDLLEGLDVKRNESGALLSKKTWHSVLEGREEEVRDMMREGYTREEIAKKVGVTTPTLDYFVKMKGLREGVDFEAAMKKRGERETINGKLKGKEGEIRALTLEGWTKAAMAVKFGVSATYLNRFIALTGALDGVDVGAIKKSINRKGRLDGEQEYVRACLDMGMRCDEIAARFGVATQTLYEFMGANGIRARRKR